MRYEILIYGVSAQVQSLDARVVNRDHKEEEYRIIAWASGLGVKG